MIKTTPPADGSGGNFSVRILHTVFMAPKKTKRSAKPATPGSLLSPEAMGGIVAGKGFDFQTRYAACYIPVWLLKEAFQHLLFEGTGDIDVHYTEAGKVTRIHIQVKDHEVTASEL